MLTGRLWWHYTARALRSRLPILLITIIITTLLPIALWAAEQKPIRALHMVLRNVTVEDARSRVDLAVASGFNTLVLALSDGVTFRSYPGKPFTDAWSVVDLQRVVAHARSRGLEVVPEIKFLTHQEKFLQGKYPELMFNARTANPQLETVQAIQRAYLDEVIGALHPRAIHIGHDEAAGHNLRKKWLPGVRVGKLPKDHSMLPADLFLKSVLGLHGYLKEKGVETWMWGDMLISPDEFPGMFERHLHGTVGGYGKPLRARLPRDIVICDWHYFDKQKDFPSLARMEQEGFRVIGATWKSENTIRNFSQYAAEHGAHGMMATTWFHVQRKEWDIVDGIIRMSGEAFLKDFPDVP